MIELFRFVLESVQNFALLILLLSYLYMLFISIAEKFKPISYVTYITKVENSDKTNDEQI